MRLGPLAFLVTIAACSGDASETTPVDAPVDSMDVTRDVTRDESPSDTSFDATPDALPDATPDAAPDVQVPQAPLEVRFLGVQGFALRHGDDLVLTAPLFTRASVLDVSLGRVVADEPLIDSGLGLVALPDLSAIISGHAHYDHLMDVPRVLQRAPRSLLYGNRTAAHLLAALAPDRAATCDAAAPMSTLARDRVVALDEPSTSAVDYRMCPAQRPMGASLEGRWVPIPGARVRIRPLCSSHPDQVWIFHFGAGSINTDQCTLPPRAGDWLEGGTLAFLIDFLDAEGRPVFRVYYQDAPTNGPVGHVSADVLAEKRVDLALLCVGSYDAVRDQPGEIIAALHPRFALSGHWEDFFVPASLPPRPIPFLNVDQYVRRAEAALPPPSDVPWQVDGRSMNVRHVLSIPGTSYVVPPAP